VIGKYYQMTPKVDQTYRNILEDLANQGKGMLASRTGQNSTSAPAPMPSPAKPATMPQMASNAPKPVTPQTSITPDFFSKPEAKDINQWAQDPNNMKKLQQSQMKLVKGQQQNQANLQQMFTPQQ
jgi:hypothetical protein